MQQKLWSSHIILSLHKHSFFHYIQITTTRYKTGLNDPKLPPHCYLKVTQMFSLSAIHSIDFQQKGSYPTNKQFCCLPSCQDSFLLLLIPGTHDSHWSFHFLFSPILECHGVEIIQYGALSNWLLSINNTQLKLLPVFSRLGSHFKRNFV